MVTLVTANDKLNKIAFAFKRILHKKIVKCILKEFEIMVMTTFKNLIENRYTPIGGQI